MSLESRASKFGGFMFRRYLLLGVGLLLLAIVPTWYVLDWLQTAYAPILVGILHSQTGPMAISEKSMIDAEVLAINEINAQGGLLGRKIQYIVADGESDWPTYARKARELIEDKGVAVVFGCWTSASRKTVKPIFEQNEHLLIYPMAYEGLELSKYIVYTGAAPNQQITPAVKWSYDTLGARKFFLVGSDYVWPHSVNEIVKDQLKALKGEMVGEEYIYFGSSEAAGVVERIKKTKPDVVLSAVVGDSNVAFYRELLRAGLTPDKLPVISFSIAEDELTKVPEAVGHYSAWNYFQSIDRQENRDFVRAFRAAYGADRVTNDVVCAAYNSVHFWAQAAREAQSVDVKEVRDSIRKQSRDGPEGVISIDPQNNHTWRPVFIGRARSDGQFEIVWSSQKTIRPAPYPITRTQDEWDKFLGGLYRQWQNSWANPVDQTPKATGAGG